MNKQLDIELLDTKQFKKLKKEIGEQSAKDFFSLESDALRAAITASVMAKEEATAKTKKNNDYLKAQGIKKDFDDALRDTKKPLDAKINAAALILGTRKGTSEA